MSGPLVIGDATLWLGDCLEVLPRLEAGSFDAVVTDPPYGIRFMGKAWDGADIEAYRRRKAAELEARGGRTDGRRVSREGRGTSAGLYDFSAEGNRSFGDWCAEWATAALRVTAPGGFLLAFGGTRTFHRLACAVEDAGWEITDTLMWLYGSGFPKGRSCLKPAWEPIILARKPAPRVRALNIDECRVEAAPWRRINGEAGAGYRSGKFMGGAGLGEPTQTEGERQHEGGRWPANCVHDGSDEVLEAFAAFGEKTSGKEGADGHTRNQPPGNGVYGGGKGLWQEAGPAGWLYGDSGTAARFFYTAKADKSERNGSTHPTVKPLDLMRWLVRLVVPKGGVCLDPFGGSMTTVMAALREGRRCVAVEREAAYFEQGAERVRGFYGEAAGDLFAAAR